MNPTPLSLIRQLRKLAAPQLCIDEPDPQLLESFLRQKSESAFAALVRRHGPMVLSVCRRVLHHAQDAEDAFQVTFLILARRADSIRKRESVGSFLHGVAYRVAQKLKSKETRRQAHESSLARDTTADAINDIHWRELHLVLDEELRKLPQKYRAPLVLCYLEGKTRDEAARQLGWTKAVFRRRLEQGRTALGRRLTRRDVTLSAALSATLLADAAAQSSLPPLLAASTVRAGLALRTGQAIAPLVSAQVSALAESGAGILLAKKVIVALVLLASLTLGIGGLLAYRSFQSYSCIEASATPKTAQPALPFPPAREVTKDETIEITGRVLDPDDKPFAGASLLLLADIHRKDLDVSVRATTDKEGGFRISAKQKDFDAKGKAILAARADGFGPNWAEIAKDNKKPITLRLVKDDVPIEGRVLDLEGRPVLNATIRVLKLHQTDLDSWLREAKRGRWYFPPDIPEALAMRVTTDRDGRFKLQGLGRERLAYLDISGETIEHIRCWVMTRAKKMSGLPRDLEPIYTAKFDHIAGPTKPIVGTVREKGTGKPLAGITVQMDRWINNAKTDEHGRYRIIGNAKKREYGMVVMGRPYFAMTRLHIPDTPGFEPLVVDFELERGIEIRGRVINKATGEPIRANVQYRASADNPRLKGITADLKQDSRPSLDGRNSTADDGTFFVIGLPGPGMLTVLAIEDDFYKPERPAEWEKLMPYVDLAPPLFHAWVPINPSNNDPKSTYLDIALEPAKPIPGRVFDPEGKPLGGYFVLGLTGSAVFHSDPWDLHESPSFQVRGVDPARPRTLVFAHPTKKLGKFQMVRRDQRVPLRIRLEPLSAVRGRILDAEGRPRAGLRVRVLPDKESNGLPSIALLLQGLQFHHIDSQGTTDSGGKFQLNGLIPGLKYTLNVREDKVNSLVEFREEPGLFSVESGKTRDLGELQSKPAP